MKYDVENIVPFITRCPVCNQGIDDEFNAVLVGPTLLKAGSWESWASFGQSPETTTYSTWKDVLRNAMYLGEHVVVEKVKTSPDFGDIDSDYYGEYPQGTTFDAYVLFRIGNRFYKATGEGDSYGSVAWHPHLVEVKAQQKTVTVYEAVE